MRAFTRRWSENIVQENEIWNPRCMTQQRLSIDQTTIVGSLVGGGGGFLAPHLSFVPYNSLDMLLNSFINFCFVAYFVFLHTFLSLSHISRVSLYDVYIIVYTSSC